nr:lipoate--protein ligase [uncultured Lachnoclostridium sp.]
MIDTIRYTESGQFVPYHNLAVEKYLLETCGERECILYLWQNQRTVVIGRNQNAWKECRVSRLEEDGGYVARRLSGGGAVYHDLGNLNFTFLVRKKDYSVERQTEVILRAVRALGIPAVRSGRNDLLADGRKFSGNAYYEQGDYCYHHGTLMVDVDKEVLGSYLTVNKEKLKSKGVDSVRSRVANLREFVPDLTIDRLKAALRQAFEEVYGQRSTLLTEEELDGERLKADEEYFASWEWKLGRRLEFQFELSHRFPWGSLSVELKVDQGKVTDAAVYSDALKPGLILALPDCLKNARYSRKALCRQLGLLHPVDPAEAEMLRDVIRWVASEEI